MKKRIFAIILTVVMMFSAAITSSAATQTIGYESSYDASTGIVSVTVYINNAVGLQAADLCLGYDGEMYEFQDSTTLDIGDGMIEGHKSLLYENLATASVLYMNECTAEDVDENGRLSLLTYKFKPLTDEYDIDYFYLWADSFMVGEVDIYETINTQGNPVLQEDRSGGVSYTTTAADQNGGNAAETTKASTQGVKGDLNSKWYVYVIGAVLVIAAIAGIAMVVVKSNHNDETETDNAEPEEKEEDSEDN